MSQSVTGVTWYIATCWFVREGEPDSALQRRICRLPATSPGRFRELAVWRCLQGGQGTVMLGPVSEATILSEL